ncbi:hypothetical protein CWI38_1724p0010 [Hamiltosporidium tvaerminnensis]|uniref:Reverse transcriptase n=1 Tax=Hamiltosporidium tvaerminnensis TaxID=1176355 RepID=A0A4Q9LPY8_9MICR|nr:hypothetical protein CWI38_1724p0010 [Hamiltosporidium tvaerminnensis]
MHELIRNMNRRFVPKTGILEEKKADIFTDPKEIFDTWAKYFESLLNSMEEDKSDKEECYNNSAKGNIEAIEYPTLEETITVIMSWRNHKAPSEDKISAEKISDESNVRLLIPLHKQSAQMKCCNNRRNSPLNTGYKVLSKIVANRLEKCDEGIIGDYQCGSERRESYEYNIPTHQLFLDYKKAYDNVYRKYTFNFLGDL